jgi:hypothetical protein
MFERISKLEHHISCLDLAILPELQEFIANHEQQLESLGSAIETNTAVFRREIGDLR